MNHLYRTIILSSVLLQLAPQCQSMQSRQQSVITSLIAAVRTQNFDVVHNFCQERLSESLRRDLLKQDKKGRTPLHIAIEKGNYDIMRSLLNLGKQLFQNQRPEYFDFIHAQDNNLNTPLHTAVIKNNARIIEMLFACGASRKIKNKNLQSPFDLAKKAHSKTGLLFACDTFEEKEQKRATAFCDEERRISEYKGKRCLIAAATNDPEKFYGNLEKEGCLIQ